MGERQRVSSRVSLQMAKLAVAIAIVIVAMVASFPVDDFPPLEFVVRRSVEDDVSLQPEQVFKDIATALDVVPQKEILHPLRKLQTHRADRTGCRGTATSIIKNHLVLTASRIHAPTSDTTTTRNTVRMNFMTELRTSLSVAASANAWRCRKLQMKTKGLGSQVVLGVSGLASKGSRPLSLDRACRHAQYHKLQVSASGNSTPQNSTHPKFIVILGPSTSATPPIFN